MSLDPLDTVRVGIIGPSWWVDYWHLPALQGHPDTIITGISGEKERDPAEVRARYGEKARYYTRYEDMLDHALLDGVIVCTPNDLHHPCTMAALTRGLHVTCEKPIALNAAQAYEMAEAAASRHLIGMSNFPYRDNPAVQEFRRLLSEGYVGKILHVTGQYHGGFGLRRSPNWRGSRSRSGSGILGDLGSHLIDLVRFVTGDEFSSVCAHTLTALRGEESDSPVELVRTEDPRVGDRNDDSCAFLAEFASGAQGILHTSWVAYQGAYVQHQEIEIYGTEGRIRFLANHGGTFLHGQSAGASHWEPLAVNGIVTPEEAEGEEEDYFRPGRRSPTNTTYRWLEAIRAGRATISPDLRDGWKAQQVIDAVLESSAQRRWVDIGTETEEEEEEEE